LTAFSTASAPELNRALFLAWSPGVIRLSASATATYGSYGETMKHVCVNCAACAWTAATTFGCALPTVVTAMPAPRSMSELPSASTTTPPPAATAWMGAVWPTPEATAAALRSSSCCERGPGIAVTRRRSCGSDGPPTGVVGASRVLMSREYVAEARRSLSAMYSRASHSVHQDRSGMPAAPPTGAPTLRALLRRRELRLRLVSDEADLAPGALDRPVRWVHSSDLADPTPFLSEGLALLTTGTQFL